MNEVKYGWMCPKCGRVWSPEISGCMYCNAEATPPTNSNTPNDKKALQDLFTRFYQEGYPTQPYNKV